MTDSYQPAKSPTSSKAFGVRLLSVVEIMAVLSSIATVASLFARQSWLADICANLRIQWTIALSCAAIVLMVAKPGKLLIVCLLMLAMHVPAVLTGVISSPKVGVATVAQSKKLTVATFNVLTSNRNYDAIEKQLVASNADVIAILELSSGLERHLAKSFAQKYPWSKTQTQDRGNFGIGLYSKMEWKNARVFHLNSELVPSIEAELTFGGREIYFVATHTLPPIGRERYEHRNQHLRRLAERIRNRNGSMVADFTATVQSATIVVGDLNMTPWSPCFADFCAESGLSRSGGGVTPTWYVLPLLPFGLVLDHVLTSKELQTSDFAVLPSAGSDHRMVNVSVGWSG